MSGKFKTLMEAIKKKWGVDKMPPYPQILIRFRESDGAGGLGPLSPERLLLRPDGLYQLPPEEEEEE